MKLRKAIKKTLETILLAGVIAFGGDNARAGGGFITEPIYEVTPTQAGYDEKIEARIKQDFSFFRSAEYNQETGYWDIDEGFNSDGKIRYRISLLDSQEGSLGYIEEILDLEDSLESSPELHLIHSIHEGSVDLGFVFYPFEYSSSKLFPKSQFSKKRHLCIVIEDVFEGENEYEYPSSIGKEYFFKFPVIFTKFEEVKFKQNPDINRDGVVNVADLLMVRNNLGYSHSQSQKYTDVDNDGVVNIADLLIVKNNLGQRR